MIEFWHNFLYDSDTFAGTIICVLLIGIFGWLIFTLTREDF